MMVVTHADARRYLDVGRDQLTRSEREALQAHLSTCTDCEAYDREVTALQADLTRVLHTRWDSARPAADLTLRLKVRLTARTRVQRVWRVATSLASVALLTIVTLATVLVLNNVNRLTPTAPSNQSLSVVNTSQSLTETIGPLNLPIYIGDRIRLLGFELANDQLVPGSAVDLTLRWQTQYTMETGYIVFMHVVDAKGNVVAQLDAPPTDGVRPTQSWQPGEVIVDRHTLMLPITAEPGQYTLLVGLYSSFGAWRQTTSLGGDAVRVATLTVNTIPNRLDVNLEKFAALLGYALATTDNRPGSYLEITLYWQARDNTTASYKSFVYLTRADDAAAAPIVVSDAVPGGGSRPTPTWNWGETVPDQHLLRLPFDLRPGVYNLVAGLYNSDTGARLNTSDGESTINLTQLQVR